MASKDNAATKWWFLAVACIGLFSNYYVYDAVGPLADILNRQLDFSDTRVGMLNAIRSVPNIFLVLVVAGRLNDIFGASAENPLGYTPIM